MQHATVVYLTHAGTLPDPSDLAEAMSRSGLDPEWTEFAAGRLGYDTVPEALLRLASRGAHRVEGTWATWENGRGLQLSDKRHRLMG
ncbi:MAG: hypothetical protein P1P84_22680 [Deferrisomatales bacterium]|nr:hypothetical protein [Deferrisomatales bacterium]